MTPSNLAKERLSSTCAGNEASLPRAKSAILNQAFAVAALVAAQMAPAQDTTILGNETLSGRTTTLRIGNSFTLSGTASVSSIGVYVEPFLGGLSFQLTLAPYDPFTGTKGPPIAQSTISAEELPTDPEGGWVDVEFDPALDISTPGIYAVFVETGPREGPDRSNRYGYTLHKSIEGGRLLEHRILGLEREGMLFRLRGTATEDAFTPKEFAAPEFADFSIQRRYDAIQDRYVVDVSLAWETEVGAVYTLQTTPSFTIWFNKPYLGDGGVIVFEESLDTISTRFYRIEARPLGEFSR